MAYSPFYPIDFTIRGSLTGPTTNLTTLATVTGNASLTGTITLA